LRVFCNNTFRPYRDFYPLRGLRKTFREGVKKRMRDEKSQPVVPSSGEEGSGVVAKKYGYNLL
jgi:hypothetical protein